MLNVREAIEAVTDANHSRNTDAFQSSGSIFTGQRGRPKSEVIRTRWTKRASALVVSVSKYLVSTFCGLSVIFCGFISHLIGRETRNIPEIFSGVHGFTGKTASEKLQIYLSQLIRGKILSHENKSF